MAGRSRNYPGWQMLLLLLVAGGIIGGWIGSLLGQWWPAVHILNVGQSIGFAPFSIDLRVVSITLGFMMHINFFTLLGFVLAYLVFRRL